jgi:hypothetical protein
MSLAMQRQLAGGDPVPVREQTLARASVGRTGRLGRLPEQNRLQLMLPGFPAAIPDYRPLVFVGLSGHG